jgi:Na+-translocating ferredoxin:NAD+ oxidoreductase RnfG subunit
MQQLDAHGVRPRSARWPVRVARRAGTVLGYVVVDAVVGKTELIDYAVGIGLDGTIRQVEILAYRESHGAEIRLPAWRRQFIGKGAEAALRIGDDITNISGATLSCTHVAEGVRRIVAIVALARRDGALP